MAPLRVLKLGIALLTGPSEALIFSKYEINTSKYDKSDGQVADSAEIDYFRGGYRVGCSRLGLLAIAALTGIANGLGFHNDTWAVL